MNYILYFYNIKHKTIRNVFDVVDTLDEAKQISFEMQNKGKTVYYLPENQFIKLKDGTNRLESYNSIKKEEEYAKTNRQDN